MRKTQAEKGGTPDVKSEKDVSRRTKDASSPRAHESLWGALLFAFMLLFVTASIVSIGWGVYSKWKSHRIAKNQPSITVLASQASEQKSGVSVEGVQATDSIPANEQAASDGVLAAKKLELSVLNGGAAKGSAGTLANFLKTEGYSKADAGNTINNYTGTILYYAVGLEKEAAVIKESVAKKYPQVKILSADTKNKETTVSQVTVILGR